MTGVTTEVEMAGKVRTQEPKSVLETLDYVEYVSIVLLLEVWDIMGNKMEGQQK